MAENLSANAGDMDSIPGPGRFHMPWSKPMYARDRALQKKRHCKKKPAHGNKE